MEEKITAWLHQPLVIINIGLKQFADNLEQQNVEVVHVDWKPPAAGDEELIDLLDKLL